jgi:hypothetical protein
VVWREGFFGSDPVIFFFRLVCFDIFYQLSYLVPAREEADVWGPFFLSNTKKRSSPAFSKIIVQS